ncbi:MAG: cobalt ECF transporter T component CbiQ [Dehalococcoidales bacterium]|nr:cobalt ECF transporter T component CbiQ [Dehalococcoidales bacterium]
MKHSYLDQYSDRHSPVHRLDPRTKFIAVFVFILGVAVTSPPAWWAYAVFFGLVAGLIAVSRVPVGYILKRSLVVIPFVLLIAVFVPFFKDGEIMAGFSIGSWDIAISRQGLETFGGILAKAWLSILALIMLTATTRVSDLLRGLERLRLPRIMVMILSFMYRYIFVLVDEVMRMKQARDSRNFGGRRLWQIRTIGTMTGTLFIRSYERGERIYLAMLARGYDGHARSINPLGFKTLDILFIAGFGAAVVALSTVAILGT